ncbi:MAG TPA: alkaline phosphatase D family protein [Telluria sp.]|nr:alkaline phosphatase D family protein [Telluria sp.]
MPSHDPRRRLILQLFSGGLLGAAGFGTAGVEDEPDPRADARFEHGVASGDPLSDRVILWTRVTPQAGWRGSLPVRWTIAEDPELTRQVGTGIVATSPDHDYTVKVDAAGLRPGRTYFYGFRVGATVSPVGRTRTLPGADARQVRLAAFCCSNYPAGFFNVYADAARRDDLDAVLHLGDYIYEYGQGGYGTSRAGELGRFPLPATELMSLEDYRARYAQYRQDPALQALHASVPFITIWDDHEFADDTWRDGAPGHDGSTLPFADRRAAAARAYFEWLPIRQPDPLEPLRIYRSFDFGRILSLHMLDTRVIGRDVQVDSDDYTDLDAYLAALNDPQRQMLGRDQLAWLDGQVAASGARWQVLGQQVLMGRMEHAECVVKGELSMEELQTLRELQRAVPERLTDEQKAALASRTLPYYDDSWDGYPAERERVFDLMRRRGKNLVVLSGDSHNAWANELFDAQGHRVGVEFAAPSVSSPGLEACYPELKPVDVAAMYRDMIPALRYAETSRRGYLVLTATAQDVHADYHFVDGTDHPDFSATLGKRLRVLPGPQQRRILEA